MDSVSEPLGGLGVIVEIDEVKFGKRKYHRGRLVEGHWVLGGIERSHYWNIKSRTIVLH